MSLANMAWVLATHGKRVLVVDWDLEAPGVHRYFHPFLADPLQQESDGLIDRLWAYVNAIPDGAVRRQAEWAGMSQSTQKLALPLSNGGTIDLLGAGRQDETYTTKVGNFDWSTFYARLGGKGFVDAFGCWARSAYDHVLIDSRTGVSDTAGICTMQLPDVLALFFVYNRQSIEGAAAAGRAVRTARSKGLRIVPCPSRVEDKKIAGPARQYASMCLEDVLGERPVALSRLLRINEVMHFPWCAYEEKLAVFEEEQGESGTLLQATEALSARIAGPLEGEVETVEREKLAAFWRRAAFRDPRLDHLEGLRSGSLSQKLPQLKLWLGETLEDAVPSPMWAIALASECVALANSGPNVLSPADTDWLGQGATDLIRRLRSLRGVDQTAVANVLGSRASQLVRLGRLEEALFTIDEAIKSLSEPADGTDRAALARALEVRADTLRLMGQREAGLETIDELIQLYEQKAFRTNSSGHDGRARAYRLRASALLELGQYKAAAEEAERAFRISRSGSEASPEPAIARLIGVRAALKQGEGERAVERMRHWLAREDMPETVKHEFEVRLSLAEAEHYRKRGELDRARAILVKLNGDLPTWASAEVAELIAKIDVIGSTDLVEGALEKPFSLDNPDARQIEDLLRQALANTGDSATRRQVLFDFLREHDLGVEGSTDLSNSNRSRVPSLTPSKLAGLLGSPLTSRRGDDDQ